MVTPSEFAVVLGAVTALVVAIGGVILQVRQLHMLVNSRMTELVELTRASARAEGVLEGKAEDRGMGADPPRFGLDLP